MLDEFIFVSLWPLGWNVICTINCLNLSTFTREFHLYVRWAYFCFSLTFVVKLWFVLSAVLIYPHSLENSTTMFNRWVYFCFSLTFGVKLWFVLSVVLLNLSHSLENSTAFEHAQTAFLYHECLDKPTCEIWLWFWCIKVERKYCKWWRLRRLETQGAQ